MTITVITPWWNHREFETDYWAAMRMADVEVLVIDNGSRPRLPNAIRLEHNVGFSHACNIGLELAQTDMVLFLNNDIQATAPGWDEPIREALWDCDSLVGANLRYDPHGSVDGQPMPYLDGWCLAGPRLELLELGGFDEDYDEPAYYSDNDLCLRARAAGMGLREVKVPLVHKLNGTAARDDAKTIKATLANRQRFVQKARGLMEVAA